LCRRLFGRLLAFDGAAMLVGMVLGGFRGMMRRMKSVAGSDMGVVRRLLVIAGFVVLRSFAMMICCVFVVFCRLLVMLGAGVCTHSFTFLAIAKLDNMENWPWRSDSHFGSLLQTC
jgi:hypothetical protein